MPRGSRDFRGSTENANTDQIDVALLLFIAAPAQSACVARAARDSRCEECHGAPESFVRKSIVTQERELIGVMTSTPVGEYLETHRELNDADAEFFTRLLRRVATITYSN